MATLAFQESFKQWERLEQATFIDDGQEGEFLYFKITTDKKQIKVKIHKREWNLFLHSMPKYEEIE